MKRYRQTSLLVLMLMASALVSSYAGSPASAKNPGTGTCGLASFQQQMLKKINQTRARSRMCGDTHYGATSPLKWNDKLAAAGFAHATDLAENNYFSHVSQDGRTFSERISQAGYHWREAGENIAAGQTSLDQVINDWLKSPGHCANIMNPVYTEVGVSCVHNSRSRYKRYWGMEFGLPQ